ncbi:MAG: NnrU family protein [Alphaproteobacteria bacterium]
MVGTTSHVLYAALAFVGIHVLTSTPVRAALVGRLGEARFAGLFSLLSAGLLAWLIWAKSAAPFEALWDPEPWTRHIPFASMPLAFIFMAFALTSRGPAIGGGKDGIAAGDPAPGFLKVTRHPLFWGIALWAGSHIPANGDKASVYFFGAFAVLALIGMPLQDKKKEALRGAAWGPFAMRTSILPFLAAIQGRSGLKWSDIFGWRLLLGLALFGGFLFAHEFAFGVPVLPG